MMASCALLCVALLCAPVLASSSSSLSSPLPPSSPYCVLDPANQAFVCSSSNVIIPPFSSLKIIVRNTNVWHNVWSEINATEPLQLYVFDQGDCENWDRNHYKYAPVATITNGIQKLSLPSATSSCVIFHNNGTTPISLGVDNNTKILAGGIAATILLLIVLFFLVLILPSICASCCCIGFGCYDYPPYRVIPNKNAVQYRYRPPPVLRIPKKILKYIAILTGKLGIDKPVTPFYIYFMNNHSIMWIWFPPLDESLTKGLRAYSTFLVLQFVFLFQNVWQASIIAEGDDPGITGLLDVFKTYSFWDAFVLACKVIFSAVATSVFQIVHRMLLRKVTLNPKKMFFAEKENPKMRVLGAVLNFLSILFFIFMTVLVVVQFVIGNLINLIIVYIIWVAGFLVTNNNVIVTYVLYRIYGTVTEKEPDDMDKFYKEEYKCYYVQRKKEEDKEPLLSEEGDKSLTVLVLADKNVQNSP